LTEGSQEAHDKDDKRCQEKGTLLKNNWGGQQHTFKSSFANARLFLHTFSKHILSLPS